MTQPAGAPLPPPPPPATGSDLHPLSIGRTLELTWGLLRYRWRVFLGAVVLAMAPVYVVASIVQIPFLQTMNRWLIESGAGADPFSPATTLPPPGWGAAVLVLLATGIVLMLANVVAMAAVTQVVGETYTGRTTTATGAVGRGLRRLPSLVGAYLLYFVALLAIVMLGATLSFVFFAGGGGGGPLPFIGLVIGVATVAAAAFVVVRWSLVTPTLMLEGQGAIEALGRSWRLVAGSGWRVLGYLLLFALLVGIVAALLTQLGFAVLGGSAVVTDAGLLLAQGLLSGVVAVLLTPVLPIALTLLYFDLRWRRGEPPLGEPPRT